MDIDKGIEEDIKKITNELKEKKLQLEQLEQKYNELKKSLEQKVIDRTVEVNRLLLHKTQFIDNLGHDLATPLTPLISLLPIVKESITDPKQIELLDTCIRSAGYIKRVVNNTRELAELNSTNLYLKKENLSNILNEILNKYDSIFKSYDIKIINLVDTDISIMTEKFRILQVFDHIISNAVNSMIENGGTLTFKTNKLEQKTGIFLNVSITDTGKGLNRDQAEHLFDEFYKVDGSRHKLDSTGLGLSICRRIIEKHGGHIWAKSFGPNKGVIINFTVPFVK